MFENAFLVFTYITEALILYNFCKTIYETRINKYLTFAIISIIYIGLTVIYKLFIYAEWINMILVILINILIISTLFKCSIKSALFHGFILTILQLIAEFITAYLTALVLKITSQDSINEHFESGVIISHLLYFVFTIILSKISSKETRSKGWGKWAILAVLPISSVYIVHMFKTITSTISLSSNQYISSLIAISLLLLVNIVVYMVYEQAEKDNQKLIELELTEQKNEIDMQYLNVLEKKNEKMQIMAHDYKNHIITMDAIADSPELKKYIHNLLGEITDNSDTVKTKNKILDVILSKYADICSDKGIDFDTEVISENLSFIHGNELAALLNNILDNAVEAAEQSQEKYISIQISKSMGAYCKIITINSCDHEIHSKKGKLLSTKKNSEAHGFGTKSIEKIINKYNGELRWNYDKDKHEFKLVIIIPRS